MNKTIEEFARGEILAGLKALPKKSRDLFKRMYGSPEDDINRVVAKMPIEKIDWALSQVENTIKKRKKAKKGD